MRLLYVTHLYPPRHLAGVEVFAHTTGKLLAAQGHHVEVLTTDKDISRRDLSLSRREHEGVVVHEITNNLFARAFSETWRRGDVDAVFRRVLDEVRPDVVHVHHLLYLSVGLLEVCAERGVPVVFTAHDFWLGCARFGQLLHADGTRCETVDPGRCGTCLPSFKWRQSDLQRRVARGVAALRSVTGLDAGGAVRRLASGGRSSGGGGSATGADPRPDSQAAALYEGAARDRMGELVGAVNRHVRRVILPAAFMGPWFEGLGLRRELLHVETTGVDWEGARAHPRVPRSPGEPLRCLFLGSLVPHKGVHVLLDAWAKLPAEDRAAATLRIHGPDGHRPDYVAELRGKAASTGVEIGGRLGRDEVRAAVAAADVLICPSLWFEIRPLVMLEAYAAGARVLATDLGGMAEALGDGLPGAVFPEGDSGALAGLLGREIRDRDARPAQPLPAPSALFRGWPDVAQALDGHYRAVLGD